MKKLALTIATTVVLLGGATMSNAQHRDGPNATPPRTAGMHGGVFHRGHHHRAVAIIVAVPFFIGTTYAPYYYPSSQPVFVEQDPPDDVGLQPNAYWYYCADQAAYYPYVQNCPNGWMLVAP